MPKGEKLSRLAAELADRLELPAGTAGVMRLTLLGGGRALVENHRGIALCTRERVEVRTGAGLVRIDGEALSLDALNREALLVTGRILSLELL